MSAVAGGLAELDTGGPDPVAQRSSRRRTTAYFLLLPALAWLAIFFAVPTFQLVATSLYGRDGSLDLGYDMAWAFGNYPAAWSTYATQFGRSLMYAGTATVLAIFLAYPLAYVIAFRAGRWKHLMLVLVIAPFFTSFLVRTLAWNSILADNGFVVRTLKFLHVLPDDGRLLASSVAVVAGLTYNFLPFMVLPLYASLEKIDLRLVEAAKDLYSSGFAAFRRVTLPLSLPGLVAGTLLTFIPAAGDYINSQLLGTPRQSMIGNVIDRNFLVILDYPMAAACSVTLMVAIVAMVLVYVRRSGAEDLL